MPRNWPREGEASVGGCRMLTAATGERKNAKKDSSGGHAAAKRNYRKRRGGVGGPLGRGTAERQTSVTSAAYESVDPGENGEVVFCSLQASRLVQIDLTQMKRLGKVNFSRFDCHCTFTKVFAVCSSTVHILFINNTSTFCFPFTFYNQPVACE